MSDAAETGRLLRKLGDALRTGHRAAEKRVRAALDAGNAPAESLVLMANVYWRCGRIDTADELLTEATRRAPRDARTWLTLAVFRCRQKAFAEALPLFERALRLSPDDGTARHRYGGALATIGSTDEAIEQLRRAVELDPQNAAAHYLLSTLKRYETDDWHLDAMRAALAHPLPARQRSRLLFALGRALEQTGDNASAFRHYAEANALRRAEFEFDIKQETGQADWLIRTCQSPMADADGFASDVPVFVVGLPRSGSTLLEHMLACHPDVAGAGETPLFFESLQTMLGSSLMPGAPRVPLPRAGDGIWREIGRRYVDRLRQRAGFRTRIIDKQLFNYYVLGPIAWSLKDAVIVYCTRDPRDVALSCFTTAFREGRPWLYDLDEFSEAWRAHRRLMEHWQNLLPDRIVELRYEDLVDDPETRLRSLLTAIGLPWSDACLDFAASTRPVETASRGQVSRPLHTESVQRWKKFPEQLGDVFDRLQSSD